MTRVSTNIGLFIASLILIAALVIGHIITQPKNCHWVAPLLPQYELCDNGKVIQR